MEKRRMLYIPRFFVENEASKYYAKVGGYSGDAGNEYKTHSAVTII